MEVEVGRITHYYNHLNVAALSINASLKSGDKIHIIGHTTDFTQGIGSMELEHHGIIWAAFVHIGRIHINPPLMSYRNGHFG
jgi:hypothetical protein